MARVLIADDDARLREAARAMLEEEGHEAIDRVMGAVSQTPLRV